LTLALLSSNTSANAASALLSHSSRILRWPLSLSQRKATCKRVSTPAPGLRPG
jgi:hypothetical protein